MERKSEASKRESLKRRQRKKESPGRYAHALLSSRWMVLFCLLCYGLYWNGMYKKQVQERDLSERFCVLEEGLNSALKQREELLLQIRSQQDPLWIEMMLMKELGVVPEGQTKVYFKK